MLPDTLAHDARFAMMHREALLEQDAGNVCGELLHAPLECFITRKGKIVGVSCVLGAHASR